MENALTLRTTRRSFGQLCVGGLSAVTFGLASMGFACNTSSVFAQILKYVGIGLQAFQAVVDLLAGAGIIPIGGGAAIDAVITLVKVGFADLQTAVNNYNSATGDKTTLLGKISTALSVLEASIQQFWNDLQIPDGKLASLIQGLLGVILAVLGGFASQLPPPVATQAATRAAQLPRRLTVQARKMPVGDFKKEFNRLLTDNGYPAKL